MFYLMASCMLFLLSWITFPYVTQLMNHGSTFTVQFMCHQFCETFLDSSVLHRKGESHPPTSHLYYCTHPLLCSHLTGKKIKVRKSTQPRVTWLRHFSFYKPLVLYSHWSTSLSNHSTLFLHFCKIRPKKAYVPRTRKATH